MAKVAEKQVVVNEIKEKLEKASSAVLVDARGLTVAQDTSLRKQLREAGVDYKVYKNTMMNLAVEGTVFEGLRDYFEGPSAIAICYEDPTVAASIMNKFMKDAKAIEFKGGVIEGTCYDAKGMVAVAGIPSKEVLLSKLLGSFKSPMGSFARVIQAIADQGGVPAEKEAPAEETAPAEEAAPVEEAPAKEEAPVAEAAAPAEEAAPAETTEA